MNQSFPALFQGNRIFHAKISITFLYSIKTVLSVSRESIKVSWSFPRGSFQKKSMYELTQQHFIIWSHK